MSEEKMNNQEMDFEAMMEQRLQASNGTILIQFVIEIQKAFLQEG